MNNDAEMTFKIENGEYGTIEYKEKQKMMEIIDNSISTARLEEQTIKTQLTIRSPDYVGNKKWDFL